MCALFDLAGESNLGQAEPENAEYFIAVSILFFHIVKLGPAPDSPTN